MKDARSENGASRFGVMPKTGGVFAIAGTRKRSRSCCIRSSTSKALLIIIATLRKGPQSQLSSYKSLPTRHRRGQARGGTPQNKSQLIRLRRVRTCPAMPEGRAGLNCGMTEHFHREGLAPSSSVPEVKTWPSFLKAH